LNWPDGEGGGNTAGRIEGIFVIRSGGMGLTQRVDSKEGVEGEE